MVLLYPHLTGNINLILYKNKFPFLKLIDFVCVYVHAPMWACHGVSVEDRDNL